MDIAGLVDAPNLRENRRKNESRIGYLIKSSQDARCGKFLIGVGESAEHIPVAQIDGNRNVAWIREGT